MRGCTRSHRRAWPFIEWEMRTLAESQIFFISAASAGKWINEKSKNSVLHATIQSDYAAFQFHLPWSENIRSKMWVHAPNQLYTHRCINAFGRAAIDSGAQNSRTFIGNCKSGAKNLACVMLLFINFSVHYRAAQSLVVYITHTGVRASVGSPTLVILPSPLSRLSEREDLILRQTTVDQQKQKQSPMNDERCRRSIAIATCICVGSSRACVWMQER